MSFNIFGGSGESGAAMYEITIEGKNAIERDEADGRELQILMALDNEGKLTNSGISKASSIDSTTVKTLIDSMRNRNPKWVRKAN